jgi:hypothetical protein
MEHAGLMMFKAFVPGTPDAGVISLYDDNNRPLLPVDITTENRVSLQKRIDIGDYRWVGVGL